MEDVDGKPQGGGVSEVLAGFAALFVEDRAAFDQTIAEVASGDDGAQVLMRLAEAYQQISGAMLELAGAGVPRRTATPGPGEM